MSKPYSKAPYGVQLTGTKPQLTLFRRKFLTDPGFEHEVMMYLHIKHRYLDRVPVTALLDLQNRRFRRERNKRKEWN